MKKLEIKAVIKYFCKKGMPLMEIHEYFMETLGKESSSFGTVNKWAAEFKRGRERFLRMMVGLAEPKMTPLMERSGSCISWLCVIGVKTCEA